MRSITDTPPHTRYLMMAERISLPAWTTLCQKVRDYVEANPNQGIYSDAEMLRLINTPLPQTTFPFVVLFAYADIPAGTQWNAAYDPSNDSQIESTNAILRFGVFWSRVAIPELSHGHHQVAVIDFPDGIPSVLETLPVDPNRENCDPVRLCNTEDIEAIRAGREVAG